MLRSSQSRGRRAVFALAVLTASIACCAAAIWPGTGASARAATGPAWTPPAQLSFYWQLQGTPPLDENATVYDIDGFETSASTVAQLHASGRHVVCYFDAGTWENFRPDQAKFPKSVLGKSNGWPGERWLDIRKLSVLEPIMQARMAMCAQKGFDAVEPDNIDGYANPTGFPLTAAEQLTYNRWLASTAHSLGLAVLQKNDPDQAAALQPSFDGVLDEQCSQYKECASFAPYLQAGKPVIDVEYKASLYPGFCAPDAKLGIIGQLMNLSLNGKLYRPCAAASS